MTVEHGIQTWLDPTTASDDQIGFALSPIAAANVSSVPQRSPLRYPGGKTWLIPHVRAWLGGIRPAPSLLIEPFAGGGIVSLTAVMEGLVSRCLMAELDPGRGRFLARGSSSPAGADRPYPRIHADP